MKLKGGSGIAMYALMTVCMLQIMAGYGFATSSLAVKKSLFQKAEKAMLEADSQQTRFFAPKLFGEAMELYQAAENDYINEKSIKDINSKLDRAEFLFKKSVETGVEGATLLKNAEAARNDAHKVMASKYKTREWNEAEDTFKRAVAKLEKGETDQARLLSEEAERLYHQVERDTVAFSYMVEIREKLRSIETMKQGDYFAPKTYQKAVELANQAEQELEKQPYGNELAKGLINQAMAQAEYGVKISQRIKTLVQEKKTFEDLFLEAVIPPESLEARADDL